MKHNTDHPQEHDTHNSSMNENKMQHARPYHHTHKAADSRVNKRRMMMTSNRNAPITPGIEPCWTAQLAAYVI